VNPEVIVWAGLAVAVAIGLGKFIYITGVADGLERGRRICNDTSGPITRRQCRGCFKDVDACTCPRAA
jgi:hypothetical protein